MKKILLSILLTVSVMGVNAQSVTLNTLIKYVNMPVADVTEEIIAQKGWELSESKNENGIITLEFSSNFHTHSITIKKYNAYENEVFFNCEKPYYQLLNQSLLSLQPIYIGSKVTKDGDVIKKYTGKTYGYDVTIAPRSQFTFHVYKKDNPLINDKKDDLLSNHYGEGGSGFGETPIALRKFTNLVMPQDDGQKTGKIAVRLMINKSGTVIDATAGVKGTTLNDRELWKKCEDAVKGARLTQSESAPNVQIGIVVFNFKIK